MSPPVLRPDEFFPAGNSGISSHAVKTGDGLRIRVATSGTEGGRPLLALHGWGCSLYAFRFLFAPLARAGYQLHAFDLKGHGLSDKPNGGEHYTLDSLTAHVHDVARALGLSRFSVLGHSMGARIGVELALGKPEMVDRLFLVNPVGFGAMPHISYARPFATKAVVNALPAPLPSRLVRFPVSAVYGRVSTFSERDVEEYRAPTQFREFLTASMHLLRRFDWKVMDERERLRVREKSAIVVGELDRVVRIVRDGADRRLRDQGWDLRVIRGVAHVVHEETPDEVVALIRNA